MDTKTAWQTLRDYAEGRIHHANAGSCPDSIEGPTARDSDCPLCQALDATQDCLAQIEEPAQPIAGYRISDPSDPTIKPWLSETPDDNGYTSEPLYAGAAPAAVSPRGEYPQLPEGVMCIEQVGGEVIGRPTDYGFKHGRGIVHGAELFTSAQMHAYFDLGRQSAQAAPALEAPAAPVLTKQQISDRFSFLEGMVNEEAYRRIVDVAAALAAAPQAPAQEAPAAPAKAAADIAAGFGSEPAKADPMREMLVRKARYWDVLQFAVLQRGIQARVFDGAPKRAPRAQFVWEVTFGNTTLNRRSLEFALWAAIKLEYEGKAIPGNLQFDLPDSTASVLVQSTQLAAAPQAPAAPWKDHLTARLVNDLRDCAIKYHGAGQLRDRIAHIVAPLCDQLKAAQAAPPAPETWPMQEEPDGSVHAVDPADMAAPAAPAVDASDMAALNWLRRNAEVRFSLDYERVEISFTAPEGLTGFNTIDEAIAAAQAAAKGAA